MLRVSVKDLNLISGTTVITLTIIIAVFLVGILTKTQISAKGPAQERRNERGICIFVHTVQIFHAQARMCVCFYGAIFVTVIQLPRNSHFMTNQSQSGTATERCPRSRHSIRSSERTVRRPIVCRLLRSRAHRGHRSSC